jgi:serine-type D-Ala-D-Ala carboxypeptidase (penicillin-binding protein 5/6)
MTILGIAILMVGCVMGAVDGEACLKDNFSSKKSGMETRVAGAISEQVSNPVFTGDSLGVELSAKAALVWDEESGEILFDKNAMERRPVASITKLLSALTVRHHIATSKIIEIPVEARKAQLSGANIRLPIGDHVSVHDLLSASLVASANDAIVALAVSNYGSEEEFVSKANEYADIKGLLDTKIANATGLDGGEQYSTAHDVMKMFQMTYGDVLLRDMLVSNDGVLTTKEGRVRRYKSTNKLLGTYFPVLAAKTGYTRRAGENFVVMTYGEDGQRVGAVVLGSEYRFQDMKVLVEWVWRNYTWQ